MDVSIPAPGTHRRFKGVFRYTERYLQLPRIKRLELKSGPSRGVWNTPSIRRQRTRVTIRSAAEVNELRREFGAPGGPRDQFLDKVRRDATGTELQGMGFSQNQIRDFRETGAVPKGFEVHHRIPLKAGGQNRQDNLILIQKDPDHKLISSQQNPVVRLPVGTQKEVDLAIHPPGVLTWPQPGERAYKR